MVIVKILVVGEVIMGDDYKYDSDSGGIVIVRKVGDS